MRSPTPPGDSPKAVPADTFRQPTDNKRHARAGWMRHRRTARLLLQLPSRFISPLIVEELLSALGPYRTSKRSLRSIGLLQNTQLQKANHGKRT